MSAVYGEDKRGKGAVLVIQSKVMCLGCFGGKMEGGVGGGFGLTCRSVFSANQA